MDTLAQPPVTAAGLPLPPHPSRHMTPEDFARWCALLEEAAAARGLPPEPWPAP